MLAYKPAVYQIKSVRARLLGEFQQQVRIWELDMDVARVVSNGGRRIVKNWMWDRIV